MNFEVNSECQLKLSMKTEEYVKKKTFKAEVRRKSLKFSPDASLRDVHFFFDIIYIQNLKMRIRMIRTLANTDNDFMTSHSS